MSDIQVFNFEQNNIRTIIINNSPWFVAKDVADVLEYADTATMTRRLDDDEKGMQLLQTLGGEQNVVIINESGLYNAIIGSKKQEAKKFKKFVTSEVLPSIRKHGAYMTPKTIDDLINNPDMIIQLATTLKEEREKNAKLEEEKKTNTPYVTYGKAVEASVNSVLIGNYAKALSESDGVKIGQNKLFQWLREAGYLMANGARYNVPYQKYIDNGYFEVTSTSVATPRGVRQLFTTKIAGKGQIALSTHIINYFKGLKNEQ